MTRRTVVVDGKTTVYWERGDPGGPVIVMLHGFRGNHKGLTDMAQELAKFRVILPDLPGYGESEELGRTHTLKAYAKWLDGFVAALELDTWYSWSHSYSSSIALIQAATGRHKPRRLVMVSLAALGGGMGQWLAVAYYRVGRALPEAWSSRWLTSRLVERLAVGSLFMTASHRRRVEVLERNDRDLKRLSPRVFSEEFFSSLRTRLRPYARRLTMPALVIAGRLDIIAPLAEIERVVRVMPHGTLVVLDDQGHLAPIERPATTAHVTRDYLMG